MRLMEAQGIMEGALESWRGSFVFITRLEQSIENMRISNSDAVM
jgi:hypothetical protein